MDIKQYLQSLRAQRAGLLAEREQHNKVITEIRGALLTEEREATEAEGLKARQAAEAKEGINARIAAVDERIAEGEAIEREEAENSRLAAETRETGAERPSYDKVARVGQEPRTYERHIDPTGDMFLRDISRQFLFNDFQARDRLARHMQEELVERGTKVVERGGQTSRATGTAAFSGLTVPQYLTDLVAPAAKAGRHTANIMRSLPLPAEGMTAYISRITTATSVAAQATENAAVSETNADDTLLTIPIRTASGQQTMSRQAVERATGALDVTVEDLIRSYHTDLDSTVLNDATDGLQHKANLVTFTSASPTGSLLYPKLLNALANVEAVLLDQDSSDDVLIMHSRRWFWLQSQLVSTWPLIGQPFQALGQGEDGSYTQDVRGMLPSGVPVVVDNNVVTNLGVGTNQDQVYAINKAQSILWEDPDAPMFIRAEQPQLASLGVLLVVYGYFAFTFERYAHTQAVDGTGLVAPTF